MSLSETTELPAKPELIDIPVDFPIPYIYTEAKSGYFGSVPSVAEHKLSFSVRNFGEDGNYVVTHFCEPGPKNCIEFKWRCDPLWKYRDIVKSSVGPVDLDTKPTAILLLPQNTIGVTLEKTGDVVYVSVRVQEHKGAIARL